MAIMLHYVNSHYELLRILLGVIPFPDRHTGRNIGESIDQYIDQFTALSDPNLTKVAVVDQAANIRSGLENSIKVQSIGTDLNKSLLCCDHRLNTCLMNTVEKQQEIREAFSAARKMTTRLNHSTMACDQLKTECSSLDGEFSRFH
jgi:hypothetical protein